MIRTVFAALLLTFAFSAPSAFGQDSGPVKTVPTPATPDQAVPNRDAPDKTVPERAAPEKSAPESQNGRFVFHRVQDSFVRLDLRTGQVSLCRRRTVGWTCQVAPDDREVLEREIARLRADNSVLKKELLSRGLPLPGGLKAEPPPAGAGRGLKLPSEADVERVMTFLGKAWHRLVEMIVNLQKEVMNKS